MASLTDPATPSTIRTFALSSIGCALGPTLPVNTASTPLSATSAAAAIPAPCAASFPTLLSIASTSSPDFDSTIKNHAALPKRPSTMASKFPPVAEIAIFIDISSMTFLRQRKHFACHYTKHNGIMHKIKQNNYSD